ncbi:transposase [Streptomyces sp. NBC_00876]|uniref:transposase n=1 Tax=Streptomyces sp. NBC_00876 TaxID=2975853 RepID=UPI00386A29F2
MPTPCVICEAVLREPGVVHHPHLRASDTASCPLSWRLFLPGSWDGAEAADRRARCRVPESEHHRPKWQLALDMLDELAAVGPRCWSRTPVTGRTPLPPRPGGPGSGLRTAGQG